MRAEEHRNACKAIEERWSNFRGMVVKSHRMSKVKLI